MDGDGALREDGLESTKGGAGDMLDSGDAGGDIFLFFFIFCMLLYGLRKKEKRKCIVQ